MGDFLKDIEEKCYFVGLLPKEFYSMTLAEIELVYKARMNKLEMEIELKNRTTARICSIIANCNRDKKKQPRAFKEDDFMPKKKKTKDKKQSVKDMKTVLKMLTIMYEGKFK